MKERFWFWVVRMLPKKAGQLFERTLTLPWSTQSLGRRYAMPFRDLFAWFCKNEGVITCRKVAGMKAITVRVGKVAEVATVPYLRVSEEFSNIVAELMVKVYDQTSILGH